MVSLQELEWGEVSQGLVWTDGIIHVFPLTESLIELDEVEIAVSEFVEFLSMRSLRPFYMAVQLGGVGREYEETDAPLLAFCLKRVLKLGPAIYLDGLDGKRHALQQHIDERGCSA